MKHYILKRRGHYISTAPYKGMDWCKDDTHSCYQYTLTIIAPVKAENILIYHQDLVDVINNPEGTCETMVKTAAARVRKLLESKGVNWNVIHIRLYPHDIDNNAMPKANMEFVDYKLLSDRYLLPLIN